MNRLKRTLGYAAVGFVVVFIIAWFMTHDLNSTIVFAVFACGVAQGWEIVGSKLWIGGFIGFCIRVIASIVIGWIVVPVELIISFYEIYRERKAQNE